MRNTLRLRQLAARGAAQPWTQVALGMACAFGALLCWTWYAVDNARFLKRNPHFTGAEWSVDGGATSGDRGLFT